jgi:hypothetical protein
VEFLPPPPPRGGAIPGEIVLAPDKEESACVEFLQAPEEWPPPGEITLASMRRSPPVWSSCRLASPL